jgi:hypothetical protein
LLLLRKTAEQPRTAPQEQSGATTNQPSQSEPPRLANNNETSSASRTAVAPQIAGAATAPPQESNAINPQLLAAWQAPIEFYGKVVDENTNPVAGVNIHFNWSELPAEHGERTSDTTSDFEGLFSLHGKRGAALTVWFSKDGYFASRGGQETFSYALPKTISPDPQNPVIFNLRKKGVGGSLVKTDFPAGMGQIAQLRHDGTPVEIDLLKGEKVSAGSGQLKLELWRDVSNAKANKFDWKCHVSVPGGGLIETPDEFAFQAPESGYQPSIVIDMPASNQNWREDVRTKYYVQLPDGKYGRIDFYLLAYNGVLTVQSTINPSGSRNLEPTEPQLYVAPPPPGLPPGVKAVIPEFKWAGSVAAFMMTNLPVPVNSLPYFERMNSSHG